MTTVINSTIASSLPSNAIPYIAKEWGVTSSTEKVLPISTFLIGVFLTFPISPLCLMLTLLQATYSVWTSPGAFFHAILLSGFADIFLGPILWAPLSEQFGRRGITTLTFLLFTIWTLACALAPNWPAFLVFRLFVGIFASAPIAVVTGIMADIYPRPEARGRAMAIFMAVRDGSIGLYICNDANDVL